MQLSTLIANFLAAAGQADANSKDLAADASDADGIIASMPLFDLVRVKGATLDVSLEIGGLPARQIILLGNDVHHSDYP